MIVLKKVNNNVAICRDGNNRELVAFGKGIGFPSMPYELTDLSKIDRTFYDVGQQYVGILCDIPEKVLLFTARMIDEIRPNLPYETSPNIILTLSDHIAFAIERYKNGVYVQMPSVYQLEQNYPLEINIGRRFVSEIYRVLKVRLPKGEVQGIAMQFINARNGMDSSGLGQQWLHQEKVDTLLEEATKIVEQELNMTIGRGSFTYARFATHTEYLLQRLAKHEHIDGICHDKIRLVFKDGKIVDAESNDSVRLNQKLDSDPGARYIGEFAIGFNPYITKPMKNTSFDEKNCRIVPPDTGHEF